MWLQSLSRNVSRFGERVPEEKGKFQGFYVFMYSLMKETQANKYHEISLSPLHSRASCFRLSDGLSPSRTSACSPFQTPLAQFGCYKHNNEHEVYNKTTFC